MLPRSIAGRSAAFTSSISMMIFSSFPPAACCRWPACCWHSSLLQSPCGFQPAGLFTKVLLLLLLFPIKAIRPPGGRSYSSVWHPERPAVPFSWHQSLSARVSFRARLSVCFLLFVLQIPSAVVGALLSAPEEEETFFLALAAGNKPHHFPHCFCVRSPCACPSVGVFFRID